MRLLNVFTMKLEEYFGSQIPGYDILSHCWGTEEITFGDINGSTWREKDGALKIVNASFQCRSRANHQRRYIWIDTCCIDKSSSAELSEAINSMYNWYKRSVVCFAYLGDVDKDVEDEIRKSRWFTRGWTLQELVAPKEVIFFDKNWNYLGDKNTLSTLLSQITTIPEAVLANPPRHRSCSLARKMSWAAGRETTREEDIAYCLLGLFEVNMPLLYGEGARAFIRLQEEIIKETDDQSLFAWGMWERIAPEKLDLGAYLPPSGAGVFAAHPAYFAGSAKVVPFPSMSDRLAYSMTNRGLRIELNLLEVDLPEGGTITAALLDCHYENDFSGVIGIFLRETASSSVFERFSRMGGAKFFIPETERAKMRTIYITKQSARTIAVKPWKCLLRWESLQTQGYEFLASVSTRHLNPETLVFELESKFWDSQGRFVFCNSDWTIYFAVVILLENPFGVFRRGLFKSVQIVPKPRGLGVHEWLKGCNGNRVMDKDHTSLPLSNYFGGSAPLTISAKATEEEALNQRVIVLEIGVVADSDSDADSPEAHRR